MDDDGQLGVDAAAKMTQASLVNGDRIDAVVGHDVEQVVVLMGVGKWPVGERMVEWNEKKWRLSGLE